MKNIAGKSRMDQAHAKRYAIQPHGGGDSYTGLTASTDQVLMGLLCPNLVALFFDAEGDLLRADQRPVPFFQGVNPPFHIYDKRIWPLIEAWQKDLGFQPATIKVNRFFSQDHCVGIEDYPTHFHEALSDPAEGEEEKSAVRESLKLWDKDGLFVLWWGKDYWLDESGEVNSS